MTASVDGKYLTRFVNNLELEYLDGFKPQANVSEPTHHALDMRSSFAFSIRCITDSGSYPGQSATDSYSATECRAKIERFISAVDSGDRANVSLALQRDVESRPLHLYHSPKTYDSVKHSYCEACNTCSGAGTTACYSCTAGYNTCYQCSHGYTNCTSCSGAGYRWENNRQVSCSSCSGGQVRCYGCSGSGRTTCDYCSGRGQINCSPCAATGYFTHWESAEARSQGRQTCQWDSNEAPEWINDYINTALSGKAHIPINRAVPWRFAEGDYQLQSLPYTVEVAGTLKAMEADVSVGDTSRKALFFMPDEVEVWSLGQTLDYSANNINRYVIDNFHTDNLKKYLHTKMARFALESVNKPSALPVPVAAPHLMSDSGFSHIKATILDSAKKYDRVRGLISPRRWVQESILCSSVFLILLFAANFYLPGIDSAHLGLAPFFDSVPTILSILHHEGMRQIEGMDLMVVLLLVGLATLLMTLFGSGRAWSRLRLGYWAVLSLLVATGLLLQLSAMVDAPVAPNWWAIQLIPDVVLCGILAGLFRARRHVFKNVGKEIDKLECDTFARMLNYKE